MKWWNRLGACANPTNGKPKDHNGNGSSQPRVDGENRAKDEQQLVQQDVVRRQVRSLYCGVYDVDS